MKVLGIMEMAFKSFASSPIWVLQLGGWHLAAEKVVLSYPACIPCCHVHLQRRNFIRM